MLITVRMNNTSLGNTRLKLTLSVSTWETLTTLFCEVPALYRTFTSNISHRIEQFQVQCVENFNLGWQHQVMAATCPTYEIWFLNCCYCDVCLALLTGMNSETAVSAFFTWQFFSVAKVLTEMISDEKPPLHRTVTSSVRTKNICLA